jgi:glycosyltransferase involved in cell wall biosynthesis
MSKISAVVSAFNEEKNIERCLKSLRFTDEIVVVDNSSTDDTVKIAKKYTNKIFSQKNEPSLIDIQKNFGFEKASGDWILSVDADEEVSPELTREIKEVIKKKNNINGYWIPRKNIIFGKFIEHTGWYPDPQLRLFRRGKGKFVKTHVHEPIKLDGESAYLKAHLIHHHYTSISEFMNKTINIYAPSEAQDYLDKGYQLAYLDVIRFPLNEFVSRFFARQGYKDGFHGLILSSLMAFYHLLVFCLIWEKQGFREYGREDFLKTVEGEFRKAAKDVAYWIAKEKIDAMKNPLRRNLQKISDRIRGL